MGIKYFEVYVSKNKEYPIEVFGTSKSGTIKVSYYVNSNGSLSHFLDEDENHSFVCCLSSLNLSKYDEWKNTNLIYDATYRF